MRNLQNNLVENTLMGNFRNRDINCSEVRIHIIVFIDILNYTIIRESCGNNKGQLSSVSSVPIGLKAKIHIIFYTNGNA